MATIRLDLGLHERGDGAFADIADREIVHLADDADIRVTGLAGGMASGLPSVALLFGLPDGRYVLAETSLRLLLTVADALRARFGDPRH